VLAEESTRLYIDSKLKFPTDSHNSHLGSWDGRPLPWMTIKTGLGLWDLAEKVEGTHFTACLISTIS
jgi:hypothetical protein